MRRTRAAAGQGLLEYLLVLTVLITATVFFGGPLKDTLLNLFGAGAQAVTDASTLLREQEGLGSGLEEGEGEEPPIVVAGGPGVVGPAPGPWGPGGGLPGGGGGGGGGGAERNVNCIASGRASV